MPWKFYQPTDVEKEIAYTYQEAGITCPSHMQLSRIAEAFNIDVTYYPGKSFVYYGEDRPIVFIDERLPETKQREDFFHELCHPLRHIGNQLRMPRLFIDLQEVQAAQFQLYAGIPFYLIKQMFDDAVSISAKALAAAFRVSEMFALKRIEQIKNRVIHARYKRTETEHETSSIVVTYPETERLLQQLYRQIKAKGL